jgi:hypothetical protein
LGSLGLVGSVIEFGFKFRSRHRPLGLAGKEYKKVGMRKGATSSEEEQQAEGNEREVLDGDFVATIPYGDEGVAEAKDI